MSHTIAVDVKLVNAEAVVLNLESLAGNPQGKKKPACDRCGFRARLASQLLVYHIDGDLNNATVRNLRTVCRNCVEEIARTEITWRAGDLEPDA